MAQKTTPAYCETCKKYTPTNQIARVTDLPQILSINCELTNEKEMNFLKKQMNRNSATPEPHTVIPTNSTPIKPCRYGTNCSRVDCHFAHTDRKSPAVPSGNATTTHSNTTTRSNIWFPHQFTMEVDNDTNELKITSEIDTGEGSTESKSNPDENNSLANESNPDQLKMDELTIIEGEAPKFHSKDYKLSAVVCQIINGNQKNLVALIRVGEQYHKAKLAEYDSSAGQWYIFNDFSIASVLEQEAVWFTLEWKVPCVLFYSSEEIIAHESNVTGIDANLDNPFIHVIIIIYRAPHLQVYTTSKTIKQLSNIIFALQDIFSQQICKNKQCDLTFKPLTSDEMPQKGNFVAMDAEFVTLNPEENEMRPDGKTMTIKPSHMSVARITCIRG